MDRLRDPTRLARLRATGLLDTAPSAAFDRLARLAAKVLRAPTALISLVDENRQFFKSAIGLPEPWATSRQTPLSHSFCQYTVASGEPLVVSDARADPVLRTNRAIDELGIVAYAGVPLISGGEPIGALCVAEPQPRHWNADEVATLRDLAAAVVAEMDLRQTALALREREALLSAVWEQAPIGILLRDERGALAGANAAFRRLLGYSQAELWGLSIADLIDPADQVADEMQRAELLRGEHATVTGERRLRRKDGAWLNTRFSAARIDGERPLTIALIEDLGREDRLRDALTRRETYYRAVLHNLPNGMVMLVDPSLRLAIAGGELVARRGLSSSALEGQPLRALLPLTQAEALETLYQGALDGDAASVDLVSEGTVLAVHVEPVRAPDDSVIAAVGLAYDVTAQRQTEAALRRQMAYSAIYAGVSAAANESPTADGAMLTALDLLRRETGWLIGHAFRREGHELVSAGLWNGSDGQFPAFRAATAAARFSAGLGLVGCVLEQQQPAWAANLDAGFTRGEAAGADGLTSGVAFPVLIGSEVVAVLELYSAQPQEPDPSLLDVMAAVGRVLGRAVERERNRRALEAYAAQIRELSLVDDLTGLHNRRGFLTLAQQRLRLLRREARPALLLFADVDGLKRINDELGHASGDEAIVEAAEVLRRSFRGADILARLGGDEFVVLATGAAMDSADRMIHRVQEQVAARNALPDRRYQLSISVGATESPPSDVRPVDEMLAAADQLMYEQKRQRKSAR